MNLFFVLYMKTYFTGKKLDTYTWQQQTVENKDTTNEEYINNMQPQQVKRLYIYLSIYLSTFLFIYLSYTHTHAHTYGFTNTILYVSMWSSILKVMVMI